MNSNMKDYPLQSSACRSSCDGQENIQQERKCPTSDIYNIPGGESSEYFQCMLWHKTPKFFSCSVALFS